MGSVRGRRIVQKVMPSYPQWAEVEGVSTQVGLAFRVNEEGVVAPNVCVTRMGQPDFEATAVQALKQWKFAPRKVPRPENPEPYIYHQGEGEPGVINFTFSLPAPICT